MKHASCLDAGEVNNAKSAATSAIGLILFGSVILKLVFIWYLEGRAYGDVEKALNFGYLVHEKTLSIDTDIINSKTFLGPVLWFYLYQLSGMLGLKLFNVVVFVLLFLTQYALGKGRYSRATIVLALFFCAFYVGTNRNIVAGEPDDNVSALLFSLGVLVYLGTGRIFRSSLLMGVAFLFKFWAAVFCVGFVVYLLSKRRFGDLWPAGVGMAAPFLLINLVDGFESTRALWVSLNVQEGFSSWSDIAVKMLSTGMLFCGLLSAWAWLRRRNDVNSLFFAISAIYFIYVLLNRDAWAITFVMMQCLIFSSFLISQLLLDIGRLGTRRIVVLCSAYLVLTSAITYQNLYRDTKEIVLVADPANAIWNYHRNYERTWASIFNAPSALRRRATAGSKEE